MTPPLPTSPLPELARSELDVMKVLWFHGRLSAREIHERLAPSLGWAYSTTRTTLERMVEKGFLDKETFHGIYLYDPAITRAAGLAHLVRDFADRVLETDVAPVVALLSDQDTLSAAELDELERLLGPEEHVSEEHVSEEELPEQQVPGTSPATDALDTTDPEEPA